MCKVQGLKQTSFKAQMKQKPVCGILYVKKRSLERTLRQNVLQRKKQIPKRKAIHRVRRKRKANLWGNRKSKRKPSLKAYRKSNRKRKSKPILKAQWRKKSSIPVRRRWNRKTFRMTKTKARLQMRWSTTEGSEAQFRQSMTQGRRAICPPSGIREDGEPVGAFR